MPPPAARLGPNDPRLGGLLALATIAVALPRSTTAARTRLAAVRAACSANDWSEASVNALVSSAIDWLAIAHQLAEPVSRLRLLDPVKLLGRLERSIQERDHDVRPSQSALRRTECGASIDRAA